MNKNYIVNPGKNYVGSKLSEDSVPSAGKTASHLLFLTFSKTSFRNIQHLLGKRVDRRDFLTWLQHDACNLRSARTVQNNSFPELVLTLNTTDHKGQGRQKLFKKSALYLTKA